MITSDVHISITTSSTEASKARLTQGSASFVTSTDNTGNKLQAYEAKAIVQKTLFKFEIKAAVLTDSGKLKTIMLS